MIKPEFKVLSNHRGSTMLWLALLSAGFVFSLYSVLGLKLKTQEMAKLSDDRAILRNVSLEVQHYGMTDCTAVFGNLQVGVPVPSLTLPTGGGPTLAIPGGLLSVGQLIGPYLIKQLQIGYSLVDDGAGNMIPDSPIGPAAVRRAAFRITAVHQGGAKLGATDVHEDVPISFVPDTVLPDKIRACALQGTLTDGCIMFGIEATNCTLERYSLMLGVVACKNIQDTLVPPGPCGGPNYPCCDPTDAGSNFHTAAMALRPWFFY